MPDKYQMGKGKGKPRAERFDRTIFVQYELSAAEKRDLKDNYRQNFDIDAALQGFVDGGYRITFKYDLYGDCAGCWVQPVDDKAHNGGKCLPGRGRTPYGAFVECCYKHYVVFEGDWPDPAIRSNVELWEDTE